MRVLLDENLSPLLANLLREAGVEIFSMNQIDPGADDPRVLQLAVQLRAILVTFDSDFGAILFTPPGMDPAPAVIHFRLRGETQARQEEWMAKTILDGTDWSGAYWLVEKGRRRRVVEY